MPDEKKKDSQDQDKGEDQDLEQGDEGGEGDSKDNSDDSSSDSSSDKKADLSKELKGLKAQIDRLNERNTYLERSLTLQEKHQQQKTQKDSDGDDLPAELKELDATLDPLFSRKLKKSLDPVLRNVAESTERMDAIEFKIYLQSEHPDLIEDEEGLDSIYQEIDTVRRNAASRGAWISREEAFAFVEGVKARKEKASRKKDRKTKQETDERKRKTDQDLALNSDVNSHSRRDPEAGIKAILEKARRGQLLTEDEQKRRKEYLSNVAF